MLCDGHKGTKTLIDHSLPPGIPTMCHAACARSYGPTAAQSFLAP
jgi:hypothetical protein